MKKQTALFLSLATALVAVLSVRFFSLLPTPLPTNIVSTPTKEISSQISTGGIASSHSSTPSTQNHPEGSQHSNDNGMNTPTQNIDVAPKQTEITKTVSKEHVYKALGTSNDPLSQNSWSLTATKAPQAWNLSTGPGAVVAVIDSGFALAHEDLVNQWYKNIQETGYTVQGDRCWTGVSADKSSNVCDDDNNGYVDDWRGWDFVGRTNNPQAGRTNPAGQGVAHGTEVAGLVGATGNNAKGIATYSWNTKLLPLQVLGDDGSGYTSSVVSAIYYAVDRGASVINMSLGGDTPDSALAAAIAYAYARNVVVVAAAGNCGTGQEAGCDPTKPGAMGYPALDKHVIAVGASTSTNARASFSSYGPGLDVIAPGSGTIPSTMWTQNNQTSAYASNLYGTSFASPLVAGYVALIKSVRPNSTTDDIIALVDGTAQKVAAMQGNVYTNEYGHGLIDANQALIVATSLNNFTGTVSLLQTGSEVSEHSFSSTTQLSSGCKTSSASYCTIWAMDEQGNERFLPYTASSTPGVGWSWKGSILSSGLWNVSARSGHVVSPPYVLFQK